MIIAPGSTDVTVYYKLVDPSTGTPETGLAITDLDATYIRDGAAAVKADLTALAAVDGSHEDNKAIEVDSTNAPGMYRIDFPDAAFAAGVSRVQLIVNGSEIDPAVIEAELLDIAETGDAMTLADDAITAGKFDESTAFPLAAADTGATQIARVGADGDTLETLSDQLDAVQADLDTPDQYKADVSGLATSAALATAQADLDTLTGADGVTLATAQGNYAPAVAGDAMTLADDAIKASSYDESTAFPIKSADTGSTQIARTGADGDTLETLSDQIDTLPTEITSSVTVKTSVSGGTITVWVGDTWDIEVINTALTLTDYDYVAFKVAESAGTYDDDALLYVRSDTGLIKIGGDDPTDSSNGTLTVDSDTQFSVDVAMLETTGLTDGRYKWWIKGYVDASPDTGDTVASGTFVLQEFGVEAIA